MRFQIGDRVERISLYNPFKGVVVGYNINDSRYVQIKRDDGVVGGCGDFWQAPEDRFKLIEPITLENK